MNLRKLQLRHAAYRSMANALSIDEAKELVAELCAGLCVMLPFERQS